MSVLQIRILVSLLVAAGVIWGGVFVYNSIDASGYKRCHDAATLAAKTAEADANARYIAALNWGNQITAQLMDTTARLHNLRGSHEKFASTIVGTCPDSLRLLHDSAADGTSIEVSGRTQSEEAGTVMASSIGVAIAHNYALYHECASQIEAVIQFQKGQADGRP